MGQSASAFLPLAILGVLIILLVSRQRSMKREIAKVQSQLSLGSEVMTHSGLFGTVRALRDEPVEIEIAPGVVTRWARAAVNRVVSPEAEAPTEDTSPTDNDQT